ncbi:uncharacterized protein [Acropora muricata]|uniref:uncharacterized protein isoform X2 n=1 Tax=Acropora muricata TaxID=159855 RepID=UPI0034E5D07C
MNGVTKIYVKEAPGVQMTSVSFAAGTSQKAPPPYVQQFGGVQAAPLRPPHGQQSGGVQAAPLRPPHGQQSGGVQAAPLRPPHGQQSGGVQAAPLRPPHGQQSGGVQAAPLRPPHGQQSGGVQAAPLRQPYNQQLGGVQIAPVCPPYSYNQQFGGVHVAPEGGYFNPSPAQNVTNNTRSQQAWNIVADETPDRDWYSYCFHFSEDFEWYDLRGKGLCWMFLLFLLWIIGGALLFAFLVLRIAFDTASSFSNQGFRPQR